MIEELRKELNEANRELMLANTDYNELNEKLSKIGKWIFRLKKKIDELLDRKEEE